MHTPKSFHASKTVTSASYRFALFLFLLFIIGCNNADMWAGEGFLIEAELSSMGNGPAVLLTYEDGKRVLVDSVSAAGGRFELRGTSETPMMHYLQLEDREAPLLIFTERGRFKLSGDADSLPGVVIQGGQAHRLYTEFLDASREFELQAMQLEREYETALSIGDTAALPPIETTYEELTVKQSAFVQSFALDHSGDPVSGYIALTNLYRFEYPDLKVLVEEMQASAPDHKYTLSLADYTEQLSHTQLGEVAPDFALPTPSGDILALGDLRGSYLLVDFWASWCGPCREENPNIVAAYRQYKDRGFDVLGVSLDRIQNRWESAIAEDELDWHHVSDLKGWDSEAGQRYGVRSIPFSVLLDPQGVIVGRNLRGDQLQVRLAELLGDPS